MKPSVAIVGGAGHVGLPLGIVLAQAGNQVTLIDTSESRIREIREGRMPYLERGGESALPAALASGRLQTAIALDRLAAHDIVLLTIGTPVDEFLDPSVYEFDRTVDTVLAHMRGGQLIILRSTVFPGVTERLGRRIAERGLEIDVAHCPERIAQGFALEELHRLPQIVGGVSPRATQRAGDLFRTLGIKIIELVPLEAELAKLFANAYRYINFAISNQFFIIAEKFGVDFARIHKAVTTDYPRMAGFAGAGLAGGPCLLKDTMQLAAFNHNAFVLGQAAMMVNEGLPSVLVEMAKARCDLTGKTAVVLGMAFKGNSDDARNSLAYKLRKLLTLECRRVLCTDPYIPDAGFVPLETALEQGDIFFLCACHDEYRELALSKPVIDVFNFLGPAAGEKACPTSGRVRA